jgi:hypothetical protein
MSCFDLQIAKETKEMAMERDEKERQSMSSTKVNHHSKRLVEQTRDQHVARIFSALDGDAAGYIRRKKGKMLINLGDQELNGIMANLLMKHFRSSIQNLTFDVFKRLCLEEFKTPLKDGMSAWNRMSRTQQKVFSLSEAQDSNGFEISFDASEDEVEKAALQELNDTSEVSRAQAVRHGSAKSKRQGKNKHGPDVYARLCAKNTEKEQLLEEMRREKLQAELEECFFYPQTNQSSMGVTPNRRRPSDVYERLLEREKQKEAFLEEARRRKAEESLQECTFKPNLSKPRSHAQGNSPTSSYPISNRPDRSVFSSSTIDLGSSFTADTFPATLMSPAVLSGLTASPLAVASPVKFSYCDINRDIKSTAQEDETDFAATYTQPSHYIIGGGRRPSSNQAST